MSRSILEPDASEARGGQPLGDVASLTVPSGRAGDACAPSGVGVWLLELGAATRQAGNRSELGESREHRLRAWSRRRSRRLVVRQALAGALVGAVELVEASSSEPLRVERLTIEPVGWGSEAAAAPELPIGERETWLRVAGEADPFREELVAGPAIEGPVVALPVVEPELADRPVLIGAAWSGEHTLEERHSSMLLERINAYTLGSSTHLD